MRQLKIMSNILLLTEGSVDEQDIFSEAFSRYGINSIPIKKRIIDLDIGQFCESEISTDKLNVFIIQGPRNRIHDFLKFLEDPNISIEKIFGYQYAFFQKIFLVYDVDHNDYKDVEQMHKLFSDESQGLLLLSSPCIEVLADFNKCRGTTKYHRLSEYKSEINNFYHGRTKEFIINNFNEIMLYFLKKNYDDFKEPNIMEHPNLIVNKINNLNERVNFKNKELSYVNYRYFSTVVYVALASALSLTKEVNNYEIVKSFFESHLKN